MSTLILLMLILLGVIGTQAVEWLPNIIQPFNLGWQKCHTPLLIRLFFYLLLLISFPFPPPHALMNESPLLLV